MLKKIEYFLPTLSECWIIVFYMVVIGAIGSSAVILPVEAVFNINLGTQLPFFTYLLPFIPPAVYIYRSGQQTLREDPQAVSVPLDEGNIGKVNILVFLLLSWLVMVSVALVTDPLTSVIPMPDSIKEMFKEMIRLTPLSILTTVIIAPIAEEFLVRGILARGLFFHITPAKAIAWSAFFFAVIHLNPWQAIPAFLSGLFLGWIYWRTHSLLACIFIHFANNGTAMLGMAFFPDTEIDVSFQELLNRTGEHTFTIAYIASVFILLGALYHFNKNLPAPAEVWRKYQKKESIENEQIISN